MYSRISLRHEPHKGDLNNLNAVPRKPTYTLKPTLSMKNLPCVNIHSINIDFSTQVTMTLIPSQNYSMRSSTIKNTSFSDHRHPDREISPTKSMTSTKISHNPHASNILAFTQKPKCVKGDPENMRTCDRSYIPRPEWRWGCFFFFLSSPVCSWTQEKDTKWLWITQMKGE